MILYCTFVGRPTINSTRKMEKKWKHNLERSLLSGHEQLWSRWHLQYMDLFMKSFSAASQTRTPTSEVTPFFIFHGLCTSIEAGLRRYCSSPYTKLPRLIAIHLTLIVIYKIGSWLSFPPLSRSGTDVKIMAEYDAFFSLLVNRIIPTTLKFLRC